MATYHRTQRVGDTLDPLWRVNCTVYSFLTAIATATRGKYATKMYGPAFRAAQGDKVGGIDLWDGHQAIRKLFPTVNVAVFANYGPTPTSRINVKLLLNGLAAKIPYVVQGDYQYVPNALSGQATFDGDHAVCALSYDAVAATVTVSDPLRGVIVKWPLNVFVAFIAGLSGSTGYAYAASIKPTFQRRARVLPGYYHRWFLKDGKWSRTRHLTLGFTVSIGPNVKATYGGDDHTLAKRLGGKLEGSYLALSHSRISAYQVIR